MTTNAEYILAAQLLSCVQGQQVYYLSRAGFQVVLRSYLDTVSLSSEYNVRLSPYVTHPRIVIYLLIFVITIMERMIRISYE